MRKVRALFRGVFRRLTRRFRRDLRFQIAFYYLLFVVPVVVVVFFFGREINDRLREEVMTADAALARSLAQDLELNLTDARYAAQELARYSRNGEVNPVALETLYGKFNLTRSLVNPLALLGDWWVVDAPAHLRLDTLSPDTFFSRDLEHLYQLGGLAISNGWQLPQPPQPVATLVAPFWAENENTLAYVVGNVNLTVLSDALTRLLEAYQRERYVFNAAAIDSARHIVAHPNPSLLLTSPTDIPPEVLTAVLDGQSGSQIQPRPDGTEILYSYAPISGTNWGMVISRPAESAFATANAFTHSMLIIVAFFLIVGILFWLELSRQVIRPLERLDAFGQAIRIDEPLPPPEREELTALAKRTDQVGHLTDTLIRMEAAIDARLDALIQSLRDALILENLDGKIVYANRQMGHLAERPVTEIVGSAVEEVLALIFDDPEDLQRALARTPDDAQPSGAAILEFEVRRHARKIDLRLQVFRVTDGQGNPLGRGRIFYDVTADRELDRMKSRLVSTVSHELRTPLASIKGYATTLLADDVEWDPQSQREFLEIISSETDRLSAMVTDLLDLSKIEAGSFTLNRAEVYLDTIIGRASQQAYPPPGERLRVVLPSGLPPLLLDRRLMEAVFRNLIENAVKYAGEDSPITITAERQNGEVVVFIQDEGPGIPEEQRERIFEEFYRPSDNPLRVPPGFGLGLTISRAFVESHGGKIWVEPCETGACFAVSLPV